MDTVCLDGTWQLYYFPEGSLSVSRPEDLAASGAPMIPATVPGNVQLDLVAAGVLPDPFVGANIHLLRPYEFHEWWYRREFDLPADFPLDTADLVCHGLDCVATVWLNGQEVGQAANMLVEHVFPAGPALQRGRNEIVIRLRSPLHAAREQCYEPADMSWESRDEALWLRKPAHQYGWDICPRLVTSGLWRRVELVAREPHALEDLYFRTVSACDGHAELAVHFQFRTSLPTLDNLRLRMTGRCGDHEFSAVTPVEFVAGWWRIDVPGAKLWWPRGYGQAALYEVRTELLHGDEVLAHRDDRVGLRTVELSRSEGEGEFLFRVNGEPIMVKGSNWVPLDALHARDAERYDQVVALFADLGCNMIRCWGGNVYEDHRFFDLCDAAGLLVWQDFAFACCRYPQDESFLAVVRDEARKVVRKLRNHPSLAVWCGDNEIDMAYFFDGLSPQKNRLTREVLPQVVHRCDPWRPYVPSSPYISPELEHHPETVAVTPEQHLWGPRDYFKSRFYTENRARFIGEQGYHGCPNVSSIERFISPPSLWPWQDNEEWLIHSVEHHPASTRDRIRLMADQIGELFGSIPDNLADFALASQISQAEAKKFFVEQARRRKWYCSGILWWNVIDCWPQFSDAVVDYYFGKKLAYHYLKRVQRPVCVMIGEPENWVVPVYIGNDTRQEAVGSYEITDEVGAVLAGGDFRVTPNGNQQVDSIRVSHGQHRLFLIRWREGDGEYGNHYVLGKPPLDLGRYRAWLQLIAALPEPFDPRRVAK